MVFSLFQLMTFFYAIDLENLIEPNLSHLYIFYDRHKQINKNANSLNCQFMKNYSTIINL